MVYNIGFAGKFYTLWQHSVNYRTNEQGVVFRKDNYTYVKNISFDKDKALEKYPDAIFNESLRGCTSSWSREVRVQEYNKFHCGKYTGRLFDACTDYDYMKWFYNNCANDDQKIYLADLMKPEGYEVRTSSYSWEDYSGSGETYEKIVNYMLSPKEIQNIKKKEEIANKANARFSTGNPFIVEMSRNLDEYGEYFIKEMETTLRFENFKCNYYNGYYYGLPKDAKGNAKRIKNKQLLIEKYELLENNIVLVKEWRFA